METEKVGKILKSLHLSMEKQVNKGLKEKDLSLTQGFVLIWLDEAEEKKLPIKTIEKKFGTAQSTTLGVINRLEQKQLITTHLSQQRTKIVEITQEGLSIVGFIQEYVTEVDEIFFKDFTQGERILFLELLDKAEKNITQQYGIENGE